MSSILKYKVLLNKLLDDISDMQGGDRLPSVRNVMRTYGVSQSTLEKCLHEMEELGAITRLPGRGVFVARRNVSYCEKLVGIIVPNTGDSHTSAMVRGIEDHLSLYSCSSFLCNTHRNMSREFTFVDLLKQKKVDGLIVSPTTEHIGDVEYQAYFHELEQRRECPLVFVDLQLPGMVSDFVGLDNFVAFRELGNVLISKRLRSFLYMNKQGSIIGLERFNGLKASIRASSENIRFQSVDAVRDRRSIREIIRKAREEGFECLVIAEPAIVAAVCFEVEKSGINVPSDLVVAAIMREEMDDLIDIPVIAAVKPIYSLGVEAAQLLMDRMQGNRGKNANPTTVRLPLTIKDLQSDIATK